MLDHFGKYTEIVHRETQNSPYSDAKTNINPMEHSVTSTAYYNSDVFRFNLSLKTLNALIEHEKGANLLELHSHPTLTLADKLLAHFEESSFNTLDRLGFRTWIIVSDNKFTFDKVKNALVKLNAPLEHTLNKQIGKTEDICITFENQHDHGEYSRISLGPYREIEQNRYFSVPINIKEGFIMDIDVSQRKFEIRNLSLSKSSRYYFEQIYNIANSISNTLEELLDD
ncbi:hypothetical protein [Fluoribacter dumoffii]|uniref:hypothetical protein n=1 Tax=Fluoribacter dumoffii TaxID=463 RepID=UPI0018C8C788|nr:hypothetical protein [Fluoribacter dumoffii]